MQLPDLGAILSLEEAKYTLVSLKESDKPKGKNFIYMPSFNGKKRFFSVTSELEYNKQKAPSPQLNLAWSKENKAAFEADFTYFQGLIKEKRIQKAVPISFRESLSKYDFSTALECSLSAFIKQNDSHHFYAFWNRAESYFIIGRSPELLYTKKDSILKTSAIAGTNYKFKNTQLLQDPKELKEHKWVIDDLVNKLKAYGTIEILPTTTITYKNLEHLKTSIECQIQSEAENWTDLLHPSPALGIYPSTQKDILFERYPDDFRLQFGAPLTYVRENQELSIVCIRNVQFHAGKLVLFAGCGQVLESDLDSEWQEILAKQQSVMTNYEEY